MADTMEDIQLEHAFHDDSGVSTGLSGGRPAPRDPHAGDSGEVELAGGRTFRPDEISELARAVFLACAWRE